MTWKSKKFYSDECGGEFTARFRATSSSTCGHKPAFEVKVTKAGKVVWAPRDPLCAASDKPARVAEDIASFFDHYRCGAGPLDGARGRRRRRR